MTVLYGRTKFGQLFYDLTFTDLSDSYVARKHKMPVAKVRDLRNLKSVKKLIAQNAKERKRRL